MRSLVDQIEAYIKEMLARSPNGLLEIQRQELAQAFACAPSQITYVLSTRFSVEQGYLVESRRGGGGFVRIVKLPLNARDSLQFLVERIVGQEVSQQIAEGLLRRLEEDQLISRRERVLLRAAIRREALPLELPARDQVRAAILRSVLLTLMVPGMAGEK